MARPARGMSARRILGLGIVINSLGSGLYLPLSLVLLMRLSGLSVRMVGATMSLAVGVGLVLMPTIGALVDRMGAKNVLVGSMVVQFVAFVGYPLAGSWVSFGLLCIGAAVGGQAVKVAQPVVVASLAEGAARSRLLALTRSLSNAGIGLGGLAVACMPAGAGRGWFVAAAWLNAASFLVCAVVFCGLPSADSPAVKVAGSTRAVLRDGLFRRYLLANTFSSVGYAALSALVPLLAMWWLHLPPALAGGLFTLNTIVCAVFGVPVVAAIERVGLGRTGAAALGAGAMAAGMGGFGVATWIVDRRWVVVLAIVSMVIYSLGEAVHSPMSTALELDVAPVGQLGRSQSVYQMSWGVGAAVAPAALTALLAWGPLAATLFPVLASTASVVGLLTARRESCNVAAPATSRSVCGMNRSVARGVASS